MAKDKSENTAFRAKMQELASQYDSNQAFAEKIGVSRQTLGFWLHNDPKKRRSPDMDGLIKVSKALNMSIDYLVGLSDSNTLDADAQTVKRITGLDEEAINAFNDVRFSGELADFINGFVNYHLFNRFAACFDNTRYLALNVTEYSKDAFLEESLTFEDGQCLDLTIRKTMMDAVRDVCSHMCDCFDQYAREYFERKAVVSSQIEYEEIVPTVANDSEVK